MLRWTLREMIAAPQQLLAGVAVLAGAFALVLFFEGSFAGEARQAVALIDRTGADVWVMQKGVGNMHMATSIVADWKVDAIAGVEGVERVTPILYTHSVIEAGGRSWFSFVVGLEQGDPRAGPWDPAGGDRLPGPGTAILPEALVADAELDIGDTLRILGRDFIVAGTSAGTFSMVNSTTFVTMADLADALSWIGSVSYVMVDATTGVEAADLARRIMDEVEEVNALTRERFSEREYSVAVQTGLEIVWIMSVIGGALAVLLTGFVVHAHIADRERDLAVLKALGVRNRAIYAATVAQALAIAVPAFALAVALLFAAVPLTEVFMPKVSLALTLSAVVRTAVLALVAVVVASVIPVRRLASIDPVTALQR